MNKLVQLNYETIASIEYSYKKISEDKKKGTVDVKKEIGVVTFIKNQYYHKAYYIDYNSLAKLNIAIVDMIEERKTITKDEFNNSNALPF